MEIIKRSGHTDIEHYALSFDYPGRPNCGFSFDCTKGGKLLPFKNEAARANYERALAMMERGELERPYVADFCRTVYEPAIGRCSCGEEVWLGSFTNTCECGRDYNSAGQQLADRSQWGEETGEHWTDCI